MIEMVRLDHVQICIPTGEESAARAFYGDVLGLQELPKPASLIKNGGLWFKAADIELHIGTEQAGAEKSKRHPAFEIRNIESVRNYLQSRGVKMQEEAPIPGVSRFSLFDPFGNRIEFLERERT